MTTGKTIVVTGGGIVTAGRAGFGTDNYFAEPVAAPRHAAVQEILAVSLVML